MVKRLLKLVLGIVVFLSVLPMSRQVLTSAEEENLALNKTVTYSGVEGGKKANGDWTYPQFVGETVVDGITNDKNKRWSSENVKAGPADYEQWIEIDLGSEHKLGDIVIDFHAETTDYEILVSKDKITYTSIATINDGNKGGTVSKTFNANGETARYVKYVQHKQWLHANKNYYGTSIYEMKVYSYKKIDTSNTVLRVGTFNIAAVKKPNVEALRNLSESNNIEIIGLQEVDKNTGRNNYDMLSSFASNKYTSSYYSKAIDYSGGEYGIGTASQYALKDSSTTFVDTTGASEERVFQRSVIEKEGKKIAFYNLHFSWETPEIRQKQFGQLKEAVKNDPIEYKVIVGDFNADQYHKEFYTFLEDMDLSNGLNGTWYDTFNGIDPTMKVNSVDNIIVSRNLKINKVTMVPTTLSDHNLLWADIEFLDEPAVSNQWLKALTSEYKDIDVSAYTEVSRKIFVEALAQATDGIDAVLSQTEIDNLAKNLKNAYEGLETYNLAYNKKVTYSGVEGDKNTDGTWKYPQFVGENAIDGNMTTRWSANKVDKAWLMIDLGEVKQISEVLIHFESAAPKYQILVSQDGNEWKKVYEQLNGEHGASGLVQASFDMTSARYVKFQQIERWKHSNGNLYSSSFYEMEVYHEFAIEKIQLPMQSDIISKGDTLQLTPTISPEKASNKKINYTSDNVNVATIDENGLIKGVAAGAATIKVASASDSTVFTTFTIEVVDGPIKVSKLTFDFDSLDLVNRDKRFIDYGTYPSKATNKDLEVVWNSSDTSVATISKAGLLETKGVGSTTITVASKENPEVKGTFTLVVTQPAYDKDFDLMQNRWLRRVVGDETLDVSDLDVNAYIKNVSDEGDQLWNSMNKNADRTYLWENTDSTISADYTTQFTKINKLAKAFGTKGSSLYQNKALYNDIISAIDFMVVNKKYNGTYSTGNWWDWQIGCTHQLVDTLMILKDYSDYSKIEKAITSIEGYASSPSKQWPSYTATGANRTDIGIAVLGSAIVARNEQRMQLVTDQVPDVMKIVTSGDGLYADGSVVQHTAHAYTGSYGNELMKGIGKIQSITAGTRWEIHDPRIMNVYNTAVNGYIPLMERGRMMNMVNGRSISRAPGTNPFTTELASGSETISNLMLIAQFAPEEYSKEIKSSVKYWLDTSKDEYDFYTNARDIESLLNAKAIENDNSIIATRYTGMKVFGSMDRVIQAKDTYALGLSMYSSRIYNYEYGNTENPKGWHTADGALYLYTNDFKQYNEGYWTTVDPLRLAGTTTDTRPQKNGADQSEKSAQSLVGGVSDGENGTSAMFLNKSHVTDMNLKAKKSWFFLNGKVIAVGSDIDGTTSDSIETTIENRVISDDSKVSVNGNEWTSKKENIKLDKGSFIHYDESSTNTQIGYYFPEKQDVNALIEQRSGKYKDINNYFVNDKEYNMDYFSLGINHGSNVVDGKYEYVLFPDASQETLKKYAQNNDLKIINNENAHAIIEGNVFALNTFANDIEVNGLKVSEPACIYTETIDGVMYISISNPKQNAITLTLELTNGYKSIISKSSDDKIIVNNDGVISIDTTGAKGGTFKIAVALNVDKSELVKLIEKANALDEAAYTPLSWQALKSVLENSIIVNADADATYTSVQEAIKNLSNAIENLNVKANKEALQVLVDSLKDMEQDTYTNETWEVFTASLHQANLLLADENALQIGVDTAYTQLEEAYNSLRKLALDLSELSNVLEQAKMIKEEEYTKDSWKIFNDIYVDSLNFYTMANAQNMRVLITQDQVDAKCRELKDAIAQLKKVEKPGGNQGNGNDSTRKEAPSTFDKSNSSMYYTVLFISGLFLMMKIGESVKRWKIKK